MSDTSDEGFKFLKGLKKFSPKEQMEMSIFTLIGMIVLLAITTVYLAFFQDFTTFFRILIVINGLFGIGFLFSMLITTYQQYAMLSTVDNAQEMLEGIKALEETFKTTDMKGGETENDKRKTTEEK